MPNRFPEGSGLEDITAQLAWLALTQCLSFRSRVSVEVSSSSVTTFGRSIGRLALEIPSRDPIARKLAMLADACVMEAKGRDLLAGRGQDPPQPSNHQIFISFHHRYRFGYPYSLVQRSENRWHAATARHLECYSSPVICSDLDNERHPYGT
jgi:hypothetical protein